MTVIPQARGISSRAGDAVGIVLRWFPPAPAGTADLAGGGRLALRILLRVALTATLVGAAVIGSKLLQALR